MQINCKKKSTKYCSCKD